MRLAFADVETTGLGTSDRIVEVAWIITDERFNELEVCESLINPERDIPGAASSVHGIYAEHVVNSPNINAFMDARGSMFSAPDIVFVAHNASFDLRFLGQFLHDREQWACTLRLARQLLPGVPNHKLQTLRAELDLEGGDAHRALGDVTTTLSLFKWLCQFQGVCAADLVQQSRKPTPVKKMNFGKHKGKALRDLPPDYRTWLLSLDNLDSDLRFSLNLV